MRDAIENPDTLPNQPSANPDSIVVAGGCFWCVEAVFAQLTGVVAATSGYAGDSAETANYLAVCGGGTNHAEVVRVKYDPRQISLERLLEIFFRVAHDPTQRDRQGADVGRQYRSAIFYQDDDQRIAAGHVIKQLEAEGCFDRPIVTELEPLEEFFPAEDYHQDFAALNPGQPYIACHVPGKLEKLRAGFGDHCHQ